MKFVEIVKGTMESLSLFAETIDFFLFLCNNISVKL